MKTYDCFTFFNELDLLDIRLNTLDKVVDYFVLVESRKTHTYNDKGLVYSENKHLFEKFNDRIIHIVLDDLPSYHYAWTNENYQRNSILQGLKKCNNDDIIMVSDLDEIPNPEEVEMVKSYIDETMIFEFNQRIYYYYLNMFVANQWIGTKLCTFEKLKTITPQSLRIDRGNVIVANGGWHFSYMGGKDKVKYKLENYAETQMNTDVIKNGIEDSIDKGECLWNKSQKYYLLDIDSTYPKYVLDNLEKFNHLIKQKL